MFIAINSKIFKIYFSNFFSLLALMLAYWVIIQALTVGMFEIP